MTGMIEVDVVHADRDGTVSTTVLPVPRETTVMDLSRVVGDALVDLGVTNASVERVGLRLGARR